MNPALHIRTQRLFLRPLAQADAARLQSIAGVAPVARMMSSVNRPWPDAEVATWIERSQWRGRIGFRLGICLKDGTLIGALGLGPEGDIAYFIGTDHWGNGYATEALKGFLAWVFLSFDLDQIDAEVLNDNPASSAVLRKLGFRVAGQGTCQSKARLEAEPSTLYRLMQHDFEGRHEIS